MFIPDIDKWEKWDTDLAEILAGVDFAFIDATFYSGEEINNRNIAQIPHPFVTETMEKLQNLPAKEKSKIRFIHFNHTNPLLQSNSAASLEVLKHGFGIARFDDRIEL